MDIKGLLSSPITPFFHESILPSLTTKQRVVVIASLVFAALVLCYSTLRCYHQFSAKVQELDDPQTPQVVIKELNQPQTSQDFIEIGRNLHLGEIIELPDGTKMTQEETFLEAIRRDPSSSSAYNFLGAIGNALSKVTLPDGTTMTQRQLFHKAVELDPTSSMAYCNLGATLEGGGTLALPNGSQLTREQQFVRVIQKQGTIAKPSPRDIYIHNNQSRRMTRQDLFLKAIELDPTNSIAYFNLCFTLELDEIIDLNGQQMTARELYLKTITLNPEYAEAYCDLANLAINLGYHSIFLPRSDEAGIKLKIFESRTPQELYLKAIDLNPSEGSYYFSLSYTLPKDETIHLINGEMMTKRQLLLKTIELDPYSYISFESLADELTLGEEIKLPDGTMMTQQMLKDMASDYKKKYGEDSSAYQ